MAHRPHALKSPSKSSNPSRQFGIGALVFALAIVTLEVAWLGWFLWEPLPNAGGEIRRWMFLGRAFPYVIPDVEPGQSYFGMALGELSHLEFLPQRLPLLLAAGLIGLAALALGRLALRALGLLDSLSSLERLPAGFGLGASLLGVVTLIFGRLGMLSPWPVRLGLTALILGEVGWTIRRRRNPSDTPAVAVPWWGLGSLAAITGPFLLMMTLAAMLPTIDYDAIEYHLQGPKEYFQSGRITFLPHNVYTSMPFSVEMLHLLGMEVLNDWWGGPLVGQLLIAVQAPLAAIFIALTAARFGSWRAAWFAVVVYLTTPWIYRLGVLPYVEGPLCFYHAGLVWGASIAWIEADPSRRWRLWAVVGGLAGGAMACKYPALISAVIPFGIVALADAIRRRSAKGLLAYGLAWGVIITPWLAKNVIDTGNPVYPLGYNVFGGAFWDAAMDQKWRNAHGPRPISGALLWRSIVDVVGRSDWQSSLYVALAPLAFLRPGTRKFAAAVCGLIVYIFMTWWLFTHRLDRFWLPLLPAAALLSGLGADWIRSRAWNAFLGVLLFLSIATNLAYSTTALTGLNEWTSDLTKLRDSVPVMLNPSLHQLDTDPAFASNKKVLMVGQAAVFHVNRPIVYNTVFDEEIFEQVAKGQTPEAVRERLSKLDIGWIYVDWRDIERFRSPGNYGFTDFIRPAEFDRLVKAGVLEPPVALSAGRDLYRVRSDSSSK